MTPEEKAKDLVDKFMDVLCNDRAEDVNGFYLDRATQCAIIAVEEIISELDDDVIGQEPETGQIVSVMNFRKQFWNEVLTHLKNKS